MDRAAATTLTSAADALRDEEIERTRHVERFLREVRIAGWIDSPHVAVLGASNPTPHEPLLRRGRKLGRELPWTEPEIAEHKAS